MDFQFDYGSMIKTGLNTKDYVAPTSFVFKENSIRAPSFPVISLTILNYIVTIASSESINFLFRTNNSFEFVPYR